MQAINVKEKEQNKQQRSTSLSMEKKKNNCAYGNDVTTKTGLIILRTSSGTFGNRVTHKKLVHAVGHKKFSY